MARLIKFHRQQKHILKIQNKKFVTKKLGNNKNRPLQESNLGPQVHIKPSLPLCYVCEFDVSLLLILFDRMVEYRL
jgi:hypothetical protein